MFADWYTTFASLAGVDADDSNEAVPNIDGMDMTDILLKPKSDGVKRRIVLPIANDTIIVEDEETGIEWKLVRNTTYMFGAPLGFWQTEVWPSKMVSRKSKRDYLTNPENKMTYPNTPRFDAAPLRKPHSRTRRDVLKRAGVPL